MKPARLERQAAADMTDQLRWYKERGPHVALRFIQCIEGAIASIRDNPEAFQRVTGHPAYRRCVVRGFPFVIVYRNDTDEIAVFAIVHGARHPQSWRSRL